MKKLAFLLPTLSNGGAERVVSNLSCNFPEKIVQQIILFNGKKIEYPYEANLIDLQIYSSSNFFTKLKALIKRTYKIKKIKEINDIDIFVSHLSGANIVNLLSKSSEMTILCVHNMKSMQKKGIYDFIYKIIIRFFYNKADKIVVPSQMVKFDLKTNFNIDENKIKVIYNSINIEEIYKLSKKQLENKYQKIFNCPVIINMGRLTKQKGQWHLIRAFKKVKEKIPKAKLVFLGRGELEENLKLLSKELGLQNDICFLGFQKNPFKYINKADVFAFSSIFEGFGNVLIESMACGTPIISTDCKAGPREILAPNTNIKIETKSREYARYGVLTPVCDDVFYDSNIQLTNEEKLLARGIIKLLNDDELRKKYHNLLQKRVKEFKVENIVQQWMDLFEM